MIIGRYTDLMHSNLAVSKGERIIFTAYTTKKVVERFAQKKAAAAAAAAAPVGVEV